MNTNSKPELVIHKQPDSDSYKNTTTSFDSQTPLMSLDDVSFSLGTRGLSTGQHAQGWLRKIASSHAQGSSTGESLANNHPINKKSTHSKALSSSKMLLSHISMHIMPNEKISVIGPNGAGKSTLMKLILGLLSPTSGQIKRHQALKIGYVPQKFVVPPILPLRVKDLLGQVKQSLTPEQHDFLYDRLSINTLLNKQVIHLSGGETQRVLLTRALLSQPNLLILDEPMQGLDPESEHWLYAFIDDLPKFLQCAMVVVSHDLHWVMRGSRRVVCLNKHICCEGQPSDIEVSTEFKKLFGHQYEQPYIHQHHDCQHFKPDNLTVHEHH